MRKPHVERLPSGAYSARVTDPLNPTRRIRITDDSEQEVLRRVEEATRTARAIKRGEEDPQALRRKWNRAAFGAVTVEAVWSSYIATLRGQWRAKAAGIWRVQLAPSFARARVVELVPERMAEWERREQARGSSARYICGAFIALRAAILLAIPSRIEVVPWGRWRPVPPPKGARTREACRNPDELLRLIVACATLDRESVAHGGLGDLAVRVLVAGLCGLRQGEMVALGWDRTVLDVEDPHLLIDFAAHADWVKRWPERPRDPPKGNKVRRIELHRNAAQAFAVQRERLRALGWYRLDGPVFPAKGGGWRHGAEAIDSAALRRAVERAELPTQAGRRWVAHSLRHSFATLEVRGAWELTGNIRDAMDGLGHSRVETTLGYLHDSGRGVRRPFTPELPAGAVAGALSPAAERLALPAAEAVAAATAAAVAKEEAADEERDESLAELAVRYPTETPRVVLDRAAARYRRAYAAEQRKGALPEACAERGNASRRAFLGAWAKLQKQHRKDPTP